MRTRENELQAAGARLLFVGTGTPLMAADFVRTHAGPHPVLSDASRKVFQAAGMRRSMWGFLHWRLFVNLARALRRGFRQSKVEGDPWQLGGVLVFDARGRILHQQFDRAGGDAIDVDAVMLAVGGPRSGASMERSG